eukprot:3098234-Pleurochrysis_carterae.AAC.1
MQPYISFYATCLPPLPRVPPSVLFSHTFPSVSASLARALPLVCALPLALPRSDLTDSPRRFVESLGNEGLYRLLSDYEDKSAYCQCIVGFSTGPGANKAPLRMAFASFHSLGPCQLTRVSGPPHCSALSHEPQNIDQG